VILLQAGHCITLTVCSSETLVSTGYTIGRFIMFSVITNIYNKKTKGPHLCSQTQENWKKFFCFLFSFLQLEMFDVCTTGDIAHIDTIFKFLTHASTWVHRYSSLLQWSVHLGQRGHVAMVGRIPGLWHIPKEKITERNVRGSRGSKHQWLVISRGTPYPSSW